MNLWRAAMTAFHVWFDGASEIYRQRARAERAERERDDVTSNLDELRRAHRALIAEHGQLLRQVGIDHIAVIDQTIDLQAARAEVERLRLICDDLRFENIQHLNATLEGPAS